jgi:hypothetical protein
VTRLGRVACRVLPLVCLPSAAWGQRVSSSLDIGGAAMRYADSINANGGSLTPAVAVEWPRGTLGGAATFSHFASGWSSQGALNASMFSRGAGPLVGEFAATAGGSAHQDGTRTGQALGNIRGHFMADHAGAWLGGGTGRTWDGSDWRSVIATELGAWLKAWDATVVASMAPTSVADSIRYTDSQLSAHWTRPGSSLEVGGEIGARTGASGAIIGGSGRHWGSIAVTQWFAPHVGVILSGGTYPIDLTQGFPGGRFLTISVRVRSAPAKERASPRESGVVASADGASSEPTLTFRALHPLHGFVLLEISAPGASMVEVSGDFTSWKPVKLAVSTAGVWRVSLPMSRGTHQINLRVNGGPWLVPPGLTHLTDEFGGQVGLLVVE